MFRTAAGMCTGKEEREGSRMLASQTAALNGYDEIEHHPDTGRTRTVTKSVSRFLS